MPLPATALVLADGRTPTGGYAHSAGLEAAVRAGLGPDGVPAFLRGRLRTVGLVEAALAAAATAAAARGDDDALAVLDAEALARTPSAPLRAAAGALGRALLRTGATLFPEDIMLVGYRAASTATPRPVALGVVAAAAGLDPRAAATLGLHEDVTAVASAAVKLLPVDGARAARWVVALGPELEAVAASAAATAARVAPSDLPSTGAPLVELRAADHHDQQGRLFAT